MPRTKQPTTKQCVTTAFLALTTMIMAGCSGQAPPPPQSYDYELLSSRFDDKYADDEGTFSGGGKLGSTIGFEDAVKAGWYALDFACQGTEMVILKVAKNQEILGEGSRGCDDQGYTTTTMELPAAPLSVTATSNDPKTTWMVRFRPTTEPAT